MVARWLFLAAALAGLVGCFGPAPEEGVPPLPVKEKTPAELIVGNWKMIHNDAPITTRIWKEFTADGQLIERSQDHEGQHILPGTYRLDGRHLAISYLGLPSVSDTGATLGEATRNIEYLDDKQLVIETHTITRWSPKNAVSKANGDKALLEKYLNQVLQEKRTRAIYERVTGR